MLQSSRQNKIAFSLSKRRNQRKLKWILNTIQGYSRCFFRQFCNFNIISKPNIRAFPNSYSLDIITNDIQFKVSIYSQSSISITNLGTDFFGKRLLNPDHKNPIQHVIKITFSTLGDEFCIHKWYWCWTTFKS